MADVDEDAAARERKRQRKLERRAAAAAAAAEAEAAEESNGQVDPQVEPEAEVEQEEPPRKKAKKQKEVPAAAAPAAATPAAAPAPSSGKTGKPADGAVRMNFYTPAASLASFSTAQVQAFREKHTMSVVGDGADAIKPVRTFEESSMDAAVLACCSAFKTPSAIQAQCWPALLSGRDVIGIAATGSGKTFAFALPAVVHIRDQRPLGKQIGSRGPVMLVLAPTRELAMQTDVVCNQAGKASGVRSVCIYGGVSKDAQRHQLNAGAHIIVATPGRLLDFLNEGALSLERVTYLVLDEADRMLDLGFERDIRAILGLIRPERQTAMFSATWPNSIQALANEFLRNPLKIVIGSQDLAASHSVRQVVEVVEEAQKESKLDALLRQYHASRKNRVLVFVLYKKEADRVERYLQRKGWSVGSIHGDKSQHDRTAVLEGFKKGTTPLLIATDVAARGLDIPDVEYVINVTFPLTIEDYVHRIGRTGRAGKTGVAHTFFTPENKTHGGELVKVLKEAGQPVPADLVKYDEGIVKKKDHKLYGAHFKEIDVMAKPTKITFDDD